jgi:hypothetical protein
MAPSFVRFCEEEGLDPDDEDSFSAYERELEQYPDPDELRDRRYDEEHGFA